MRTVELFRERDITGVSGTGVVADGVEFADGVVVLRWFGQHRSTVVWSDIATAMVVHGHDGATTARATAIVCPDCRRMSHHPEDIRQGYCGACHEFTSIPWNRQETDEIEDEQ